MHHPADHTWLVDIIEHFDKLGGEATYPELYSHIKAHPGRHLGENWEAVVRRTIEEHSSDTAAFTGRHDIFKSVDGLGAGKWALRHTKSQSLKELESVKD